MKLNDFNIALIGCGRMGTALVTGALNENVIGAENLWVRDVSSSAEQALAEASGAHRGVPPDGPSIWVLAVKPQIVAPALEEISVGADDIIISVAAGVRIEAIRAAAPNTAIVRAMPNTPALIGQGITGVLADPSARDVADALFGAVGEVVHLSAEKQFDALTAVSGSGPAYVFVAIEALADGGVAMGLPRDTALKLAIQTVLGSAALAQSEGVHPAELKDRVASPGGTTIAGLAALESGGFRAAIIAAVRAAAERSYELGKGKD